MNTLRRKINFNSVEYDITINRDDASGEGCITEIINRNEYCLDKFMNLKNKIILDIGANVGLATIILAKQNPESIIYSFEPFENCFNILLQNIENNKLVNVVAIKKAVSNISTTKTFYSYDGMTGGNTLCSNLELFEKEFKKINYENIDVLGFNDFLQNYKIEEIELLKIDCEGSEYDILYENPFIKNIKNIVGEFHDFTIYKGIKGYNGKDLYEFVNKNINGLKKITFLDLTKHY